MNRWREYQAAYWRETRIDVEDATARYVRGETLHSIGRIYGVTRQRVHQVLSQAHGGSIAALSLFARANEARN